MKYQMKENGVWVDIPKDGYAIGKNCPNTENRAIYSFTDKVKSYFSLKFVESCFMDTVSGKMVNRYTDCFGVDFLKDGRWSSFSVQG